MKYQPGTKVRIKAGAFAGTVGVVAEIGSRVIGVRVPSKAPFFTCVIGFDKAELEPVNSLADVEEAWL